MYIPVIKGCIFDKFCISYGINSFLCLLIWNVAEAYKMFYWKLDLSKFDLVKPEAAKKGALRKRIFLKKGKEEHLWELFFLTKLQVSDVSTEYNCYFGYFLLAQGLWLFYIVNFKEPVYMIYFYDLLASEN